MVKRFLRYSNLTKCPPTFSLKANLDMLMGKRVTSNIITTFFSCYYIIIQKIIRNGQAVLEILIFEKSSDLIGREFGQTGFFRKNRAGLDFCHFSPIMNPYHHTKNQKKPMTQS